MSRDQQLPPLSAEERAELRCLVDQAFGSHQPGCHVDIDEAAPCTCEQGSSWLALARRATPDLLRRLVTELDEAWAAIEASR